MDLYRIDSAEEFEMIGPEEMLDGTGISVVEWAEKAGDFFPERTMAVTFSIEEGGKRKITIEGTKW